MSKMFDRDLSKYCDSNLVTSATEQIQLRLMACGLSEREAWEMMLDFFQEARMWSEIIAEVEADVIEESILPWMERSL